MALRNIVTVGDSVLNKACRPVTKFDKRLHTLLDDMADTLDEAQGAGLAAPQVGILRRVVLVDVGDENGYLELINPEIIETSGEQTGLEGCLSVPGKWGIVTRPAYGPKQKVRRLSLAASVMSAPILMANSTPKLQKKC